MPKKSDQKSLPNIEIPLAKTGEQFRMVALMEEQNSNNRIVLEGLQALWQRQDRIEKLR